MKTYNFFFTILICLIGSFVLSSCGSQSKESESDSTCKKTDNSFQQALREQVSDIKGDNDKAAQQWQELEQARLEEARLEQARLEEARLEEARLEEARLEQNNYSWMDGTWINRYDINDPYLGRVHMETQVTIDTKKQTLIAKSLTDGTTYSGNYHINEAQNTIGVKDIYFNFDPERKRLYDKVKGYNYYYQKTSTPNGNRGNSDNTPVVFNSIWQVMDYLNNRFKLGNNVLTVRNNCIYVNGNQISNAIMIESMNGSRALISFTSPYGGGAKSYITVDASRGTITDNQSGDVYYIQK